MAYSEEWWLAYLIRICKERFGIKKMLSAETHTLDVLEDSLDFVEFIMHIEDDLGVELPEAPFARARTLGDLARLLSQSEGR